MMVKAKDAEKLMKETVKKTYDAFNALDKMYDLSDEEWAALQQSVNEWFSSRALVKELMKK